MRNPHHHRGKAGLLCVALGALAAAPSAVAGPKDFAIYTTRLGGDSEQAQPYVDKLSGYIEEGTGWAKGSTKGTFLPSKKEAIAFLDSKQPGFGMMEPALYFELRKDRNLHPIAQVDSADLNTPKLHVVVKNPAFKSLDDLKDKKVWTQLADSPRFLGKEEVFRIPVLGRLVTATGQIPVYRESGDAARAFSAAVEGVREGECVAIYPEATLTRDPDLWPMVGKTGAARVALTTGCPVVPIAQWGPQEILWPYAKRPHLLPRRTVHVLAGPPVDLSAFHGAPLDGETLRGATDAILDAVAALLGELRGEAPPAVRWDPRQHGQPRIGDPNRVARDEREAR